MNPTGDERLRAWLEELVRRHLAHHNFTEVRRGLQSLSSLYVERRGRLASGAAFDGAGKRAAFAIFYAPMHFLLVRHIVRSLAAGEDAPRRLVDLGCGTGAAGAAWALEVGEHCRLEGLDLSGWAIEEARWTYRLLGVRGRALRRDLLRAALPRRGAGILAAYTLNELGSTARARLLPRLLGAARRGAQVLIVEPVADRIAPWWKDWSASFARAGGRQDAWRIPCRLPEPVRRLGAAAGLDHRELKAKSLYLSGADPEAAARVCERPGPPAE